MATSAPTATLTTKPRQRFGMAQVWAVLLLLLFMAQAGWLITHTSFNSVETGFVSSANTSDLMIGGAAHPAQSSMLTARMAHWHSFAQATGSRPDDQLARFPFLIFGTLLGASLWYVARRLYGNAGGYIALALYTFSPVMITYSARVEPTIGAAWAVFGCIFTGIAVAHTLYAPREVVLWNWRRILLLGLAIGLGAASMFATLYAIPVALAFMFWAVPHRRGAALAIMGAACFVGLMILLALYGFQLTTLAHALANSQLLAFTPRLLGVRTDVHMLALFFWRNGAGFILLLLTALITYGAWPRTRFFGNTAPLLVAALLMLAAIAMPHIAGFAFLVVALPFLFVFVAGVFADLLETKQAPLVLGIVLAVVATNAFFSISDLLLTPLN